MNHTEGTLNFVLNFQLVKYVETGPLGSIMGCSRVMAAAGSTSGRAGELSRGCASSRDNARWTKAVATTAKPAGLRNVSRLE